MPARGRRATSGDRPGAERSLCAWQGHVSALISDQDLATFVFGTALVTLNPLRITCDDGSPAAATNPKAPPAAR
jgi:hypothetical protein